MSAPISALVSLPSFAAPPSIINQYPYTPINVMAEDVEMVEVAEDLVVEDVNGSSVDFELEYGKFGCMEFEYTGVAPLMSDYFSFQSINDTLAMLDVNLYDDSDSDSDSESEGEAIEDEGVQNVEWYEVVEPTITLPTFAFGAWRSPKRTQSSPHAIWSL